MKNAFGTSGTSPTDTTELTVPFSTESVLVNRLASAALAVRLIQATQIAAQTLEAWGVPISELSHVTGIPLERLQKEFQLKEFSESHAVRIILSTRRINAHMRFFSLPSSGRAQ